jgi:hypothetical protein
MTGEEGAKRGRAARAERAAAKTGPGEHHDETGRFAPGAMAALAMSALARRLGPVGWISAALHEGAAALHALVGTPAHAAVASAHVEVAASLRSAPLPPATSALRSALDSLDGAIGDHDALYERDPDGGPNGAEEAPVDAEPAARAFDETKVKRDKGRFSSTGRSKAAGEARKKTTGARKASDAAKDATGHADAAKAHRDAAAHHDEAALRSRKPEHRASHERVAAEHRKVAAEHAKLAKPKPKPKQAPQKEPIKAPKEQMKAKPLSEASKSAQRATDDADRASQKAASSGDKDDHSEAAFRNEIARQSHERAAVKAKGDQKQAHIDKAAEHQQRAQAHRAERLKIQKAEMAPWQNPPRPDAPKGDERDAFWGAGHGAPVGGLHRDDAAAATAHPQAAEEVKGAIGHLPKGLQEALSRAGVRHESVERLGEGKTSWFRDNPNESAVDTRKVSEIGGVHSSSHGAFTALGTSNEPGRTALHEIGHGLDFSRHGFSLHSNQEWFRDLHDEATSARGNDRLSKWQKDVGHGEGDYFRQGDGRGRRELFAELFAHSFRSEKTRELVDKHFPGFRDRLAKEVHQTWKDSGIV